MKLKEQFSLFNMGDTSIRVKKIVEINKIILKELNKYMSGSTLWERNKTLQENFYQSFLKEIQRLEESEGNALFQEFMRQKNYQVPKPDKLGFRGRTLTNALVKLGVIQSDRKLSQVGQNYLVSKLKKADKIEELLELDMDNLLYFRQLLKLRIYDNTGTHNFYNFRFAIKFLSQYKDVPQDHLLTILESIRPIQSSKDLEIIISKYSDVHNGLISFDDFNNSMFSTFLYTPEDYKLAEDMFDQKNFNDNIFTNLFNNKDGKSTSLLYKEFVVSLIKIQEGCSDTDVINQLYDLSKNDKIKKAFGCRKIPLKIDKNDTANSILTKNRNNPLLNNKHIYKYIEFLRSKKYDLILEYSDMAKRTFQTTGIINFSNNLANLNNDWIISPLLDILDDRFTLSSDEPYDSYELNPQSDWFKDLTLTDILSIEESDIKNLYYKLGEKFGTQDIEEIREIIDQRHENAYRAFVEDNFPKEKIIKILNNIILRNDKEVFKDVTDNATISTIYEYILTIAWYYLSTNKSYKLSKSFQVTLDGNRLPLVHRGGGAGDIEIISDDYSILLDATLMDINTQKRGELEPVIRHSTNFALSNLPNKTQTIFIANELDNNVLNIFRAMQFIQLNGTLQNSNSVNGLNIFAFTTSEIILLLEREINDLNFLNCINSHLNSYPTNIQNGWRNQIVNELFS